MDKVEQKGRLTLFFFFVATAFICLVRPDEGRYVIRAFLKKRAEDRYSRALSALTGTRSNQEPHNENDRGEAHEQQ